MSTIRGSGKAASAPALLLLAGLLLFFLTDPCRAAGTPTLHAVRFSGSSAIPQSELRSAITLAEGEALSDSVVRSAVTALRILYAGRGYLGVSVVPTVVPLPGDGNPADLLLEVREGVPTEIRKIRIGGARAISPAALLDLMRTGPGDVPDTRSIEEDISALLAAYDAAGYPFARVSVSDIVPVESPQGAGGAAPLVDVHLLVTEGREVEISEVRLRGNTETNDDVILRESRMELPVKYDPARIARFAARLRRLGLFSSVADPEVYETERGDGLLVSVTEGGQNTFDGILGYLPPAQGGGEGRVTGLVAVSMRNLFGTGRRMEAEWSRDGRASQHVRLGYAEPWVFGLPVNLGGKFFQRQQDSSYVDRSVEFEAELMASASLSVSGVAGQKKIIPSENPGPVVPARSTTTTAGIALRYDTRDDRILPTRGVDYRSEVRAGTKKSVGAAGPGRTVRSLGLDLDVYLPVRRRQVLDLGVHGRQLSVDGIEQGDLFLLGGVRTMRGFRENRFSGSRVVWGTAEYRLLTGGKTFFFLFIDPGYVYTPLTEPSELLTFGYGTGVRLETPLGLVGVSLALGKGDPISETKIHFGLVNNF